MSFNVALTGLNAATQDLAVVSNNLANSATVGFKSSRAEFGDIYAATATGLYISRDQANTWSTATSSQLPSMFCVAADPWLQRQAEALDQPDHLQQFGAGRGVPHPLDAGPSQGHC